MKKLMKSLCVALPATFMASTQAEMVIDFSNSECFPTGRDSVQINNIRVDTEILNPFSGESEMYSVGYDVPFRLDMARLVLVPYLEGAVSDNENRNCAALTVVVNNAVTGEPLVGVPVNVGGGNIVQTDESGRVSFSDLSDGMLEVTANASGFNNMVKPVPLFCGEDNSIAFNLNPTEGENALNVNEVRVVLSWGQNPVDLDGHLTGPAPGMAANFVNEEGRFHMYWDLDWATGGGVAWLDVDDVDSYGPETITISPPEGESQLRAGTYRYTVYQFEGLGIIDDSVTVELYIGNNPARTFKPPVNGREVMVTNIVGDSIGIEGNIWTVFELRVNEAGDVSVQTIDIFNYTDEGSYSVRNAQNGSVEPVNILYGK